MTYQDVAEFIGRWWIPGVLVLIIVMCVWSYFG